MQITETTQLQLEAEVVSMLVLQGLGACPVPNTKHPTVIQSSSLEETKQKASYSRNGTQLTTRSVPPFNFFCTICKRPQCTEGCTESLLCRGFPQEETRGPGSGEVWALAGGSSSVTNALLAQTPVVGKGSPLQNRSSKFKWLR